MEWYRSHPTQRGLLEILLKYADHAEDKCYMILRITETGPTEEGHYIVGMSSAHSSSMVAKSYLDFEEPLLLVVVLSDGRDVFSD